MSTHVTLPLTVEIYRAMSNDGEHKLIQDFGYEVSFPKCPWARGVLVCEIAIEAEETDQWFVIDPITGYSMAGADAPAESRASAAAALDYVAERLEQAGELEFLRKQVEALQYWKNKAIEA